MRRRSVTSIGRRLLSLWRGACAVLLLLSGAQSELGAQSVRGTVRDVGNGLPVAGAIIVLLDSTGTAVVRGLTGGQGTYRVPAASTVRRARVLRIGYRPFDIALVVTGQNEMVLDVGLTAIPTLLAPITVSGNSRCPRRADTERAFGLWDQTRAGLLATVVAREAAPAEKLRIRYEQVFASGRERLLRHTVRLSTESDSLPSFFAARSAGDFVRDGFVEAKDGHRTFFGPDAEVLLDDEFLLAYCLRLGKPDRERPQLVGLEFSPVRRRQGIVEITGTVWIDTVARALHEIDFRYLDLGRGTDRFRPGGSISFLEMSNGVVLIDHWEFRLVGTAADTAAMQDIQFIRATSSYLNLTGGQLARASWPDGTEWRAMLGALSGRLLHRNGTPAAGVAIALDDTDYLATSDSTGAFVITDLVPGPYSLIVAEPRIAPLGLRIPLGVRFMAVADSIQYASLVVPTLEEYVLDRCDTARQRRSIDTTFVLGRVFLADGSAAQDARVSFAVGSGLGAWRAVPAYFITGETGVFQSCHDQYIPGSVVRISVRDREGRTTTVEHPIESRLSVLRIVIPR